jgi:predicted PurR-regulated permease PerM
VLVALITVDPVKAIEVIVLFFVVFEVEGNVIQPLVMSRSVHVDPLLVIVAVLVGINLLGIIGAILAVPVVAAVQILVVRVLAPYIRRNHPQPMATVVTTESTAPPIVDTQDHSVAEA